MKRGTQFLILSFFFALCLAQPADWDQSLDGDLLTVAHRNYPIPNQPDLTWMPQVVNGTDLNNNNNTFLRTYTSANITVLLTYETANKSADDSFRAALTQNATAFLQLRSFMAVALYQILNGKDNYDPTVQDFVIVARHQLRALAANYRQQELERFNWWYQKQVEFAQRRAVIRDARIMLLQGYRNVTNILEGLVTNKCLGLGLLGVCNVNTLLDALAGGLLANLANLTNSINAVNKTLQNLTSLVTSYNADLQAIAGNFNNTIGNYTDDAEDYAQVLLALKNYRSYELPTWEDVVTRLQVLLFQDEDHVVFKRLVRKLWVGWQFGLDGETISFENATEIDQTSQVLDFTFAVLLARDELVNSTLNETKQAAALKLQSAIKTVLQTYAFIPKLVSYPVELGDDGIAHVRITISFVDVDGARQVAWLSRNVTFPDPSTYQKEYDDFVAALGNDLNGLTNTVNETLQNLAEEFRRQNEEIEANIAAFIQARDEYYANATAEIRNITQEGEILAAQVAELARLLAQKYALAANRTALELNLAVARVNASIHEADARVQVLKLQAIQIALAIKNTTEQTTKDALQSTLDTLNEQVVEALQYRELKRQIYVNASADVEMNYQRAREQQVVIEENVRNITANVTIALVTIKERIRNNFQEFVNTVVISYKAYRQSLNNLNISANSDLDVNDNVSLSFTVMIVDSGILGEEVASRVRTQIALLRAIFASITTDVNVQVTRSSKRQTGSDVYTVSSGTPSPTPTPVPTTPTTPTTPTPVRPPTPTTPNTPTPVGTPTPVATPVDPTPVDVTPVSGALSVAMSFVAVVACLFITLF